jgi:nucleoside-diphosphate-sugar epimerase
MRILVIGGTGFVGPHVVRRLVKMGHTLIVLHRGETEADLPSEVEHLHHPSFSGGYREGFEQFADEFKRFAPDVVLDMILFTERSAQALMQTFKGIAGRVVAISSMDVYRAAGRVNRTEPGPIEPMPLTEEAPLREKLFPARGKTPREATDPQRWLDDYEKILVEQIIMNEPALPGTILRWPAVYGPGDAQHRLFGYLKRMDDERPAIILGEGLAQWHWSRGYAENMAEATVRAVTDTYAIGRLYNVAEQEALSEADWVKRVASATGWKGDVVVVPKDRVQPWMEGGSNTDQEWFTDTTRIREELGYKEIISQSEALQRTVEWERANPPAEINPEHFNYAREDAFLAEL